MKLKRVLSVLTRLSKVEKVEDTFHCKLGQHDVCFYCDDGENVNGIHIARGGEWFYAMVQVVRYCCNGRRNIVGPQSKWEVVVSLKHDQACHPFVILEVCTNEEYQPINLSDPEAIDIARRFIDKEIGDEVTAYFFDRPECEHLLRIYERCSAPVRNERE